MIQAAHFISSCVAVVTIDTLSDLGYVSRLFVNTREEIERQGQAEVLLAGRRFTIKKQCLDDLEQNNCSRLLRT